MIDLQALIGRACGQLTQREADRAAGRTDHDDMGGLLFFGNPMETTPRRLLVDERLSPVDKIGWMAFRMMASKDRETSFPSYDALQRLLSSRADSGQASKSTVNRVVYILRLTRWLSLCHQARNTANGRMVGNIYALHDEPVSIVDAAGIDTDYIAFVGRCRSHGNQAVRKAANIVFDELADDSTARYLMTRLGLFEERLSDHELSKPRPKTKTSRANKKRTQGTQPEPTGFENRTGAEQPSSNFKPSGNEIQTQDAAHEFENETWAHAAATKSNPVDNTGPADRVRFSNPYTVRTLQETVSVKVRTEELDWSSLTLNSDEQQVITRYMSAVPEDLHQAIINEAAARRKSVRNMSGYLIGLIDRAKTGQLKLTVEVPQQPTALPPAQPHALPQATAPTPKRPPLGKPVDIASEIQAIRSLVGMKPSQHPQPATTETQTDE
ncbi:STY4528 family pathogenicity island replication protein [Pseudomonas sp. GOM7]|uniref:STY4528 family pathogenicity island replication protein n=1 Tax=Pseudomonas sp. GOM7 TaxID=2998079 RepID=UPI00227C389F|nr:STY4528 family pathogenicity island replication protein [Pseudomonas sp. GOM7]WAJ37232.1 STY4528 family pathogenicity island replication protein [Pseudomonas sp. GOM7]